MSSLSRLPLVFGVALAAGLATARFTRPVVEPQQVPPQRSARNPEITRERAARSSHEELVARALMLTQTMGKPGFNPYTGLLVDWTDGEVRAALEESLCDPDCMLPGAVGESIPVFLFAEWMRRDLHGALAWFEALPSPRHQSFLSGCLANFWPPEHAEEGLALALAGRKWMGTPQAYVTKAIENRAAQGPAAVEALLQDLLDKGVKLGYNIRFPENFDFKTLAASETFQRQLALAKGGDPFDGGASLFRAWIARERDDAFDWLIQQHDDKLVSSLILSDTGKPDHYPWLAGKLEAATGHSREQFTAALTNSGFFAAVAGSDQVLAFVGAFKDLELADSMRQACAQEGVLRDVSKTIPLLESIPDPAQRILTLESINPAQHSGRNEFDARDEQLLRIKLKEWGAEADRIEAIISRIRTPTGPAPP